MEPFNLMTEYTCNPLAIGTTVPRFTWEVPLAGRHSGQSAYHLLVASRADLLKPGQADLWDTGRLPSSQSVNVEYAGRELKSNMVCHWCVQIWDDSDTPSGFSAPQTFGTALFDESDWKAEWIGLADPGEPYPDATIYQRKDDLPPEIEAFEPDLRSPMLRKQIVIEKPVNRARAFVCGVGFHEFHLNGGKVGDDVLCTARTEYRERALYATYDVTSELTLGDNVLGLMLGNSWFNGQKRYWGWQQQWHGSPRGIVQLEIEFDDGTRQTVVSDDTWRGDWSPIIFNCIYDGEHYDARLEQPGWNAPGFDASAWQPVNVLPSPTKKLVPATHEDERITAVVPPVFIKEPEPGVFVVDLGVNMTGWVRLEMSGGTPGETVVLHYGEAQHEDGSLNASSNNAAHQRDEYTMKGGDEVYEPRFTFHGFQFVEIRNYPGTLTLESVTSCFVRTAVEKTGTFECGNDLINKIHRCTLQSQLCNVQLGVPTDDTQRPERLGWGADAWATAQEALYNLWMPRVYQKWFGDFRDQQLECGLVGMIAPQPGAEEDIVWSNCFVIMPWWQYLHCGDKRVLEENYSALKRYVTYLQRVGVKEVGTTNWNDIIERLMRRCPLDKRISKEEDRGHLQISQWGDHLSTAEGWVVRSGMPLSISTAFYYLDLITMAKIADVIGEVDDAEAYESLAAEVKDAFNERFFDPMTGYYDTGVQSAQAWPLAFGLVPDEDRERVTNYFVSSVSDKQRHLTTGYASTKWAIHALSMVGRDDIVWNLATSTDYPSWGFMLRNNRTTSCEQWGGERGSLNHAPLGAAIDEWFYSSLAGIRSDADAPGFKRVVFKPHIPENLSWAKGSLQTPYGLVSSGWAQVDGTVTLTLDVPANATGIVYLPVENPDTVKEGATAAADADGVTFMEADDGECVFTVGSGRYVFEFKRA